MEGIRGVCKECGEEFFVDSENCGTDESLCEECFSFYMRLVQMVDNWWECPVCGTLYRFRKDAIECCKNIDNNPLDSDAKKME